MFETEEARPDGLPEKPGKGFLNRMVMRSLATARGQALAKRADLDSEDARALHRRLLGFYLHEMERQADNRAEAAADEDFFDNQQWTDEELAELEERGQIPIVWNVIATTVNWILGSERRIRADFKVQPRRKEGGKAAQKKTEYLKYLSDVNMLPFERSAAFAEMVKSGLSWMEDGVQDGDGEPIYSRHSSWRDNLHDSAARRIDLSDRRYHFRAQWVDADILKSIFPHRTAQIDLAATDRVAYGIGDNTGDEPMDSREEHMNTAPGVGDADVDFSRPRVRAIEGWFTKPCRCKVLARGHVPGSTFAGEIYDPMSRGHWNELASGQAVVVDKTQSRVFMAVMTDGDLLHVQESPYRHNRIPFTPLTCYRRGRDGQFYGVIRGMRQIQRDINMRMVKALAILSSNKTIMEEGAVPDLDEYRAESSRADAVIVKKRGAELTMNADRELVGGHLELFSRGIAMIQQVSGVTDENMGRTTNARSGKAILARQEQGGLATAAIFDNLRLAAMKQGEIQLSLVEQFVAEEKQFRITTSRGGAAFVDMNGTDPETGDVLPEDDVTAMKADFIISEQAWSATARAAQAQELIDLVAAVAPGAPQVAMVCLDLIIELMDVANRDEIVKRIRQQMGLSDPDADEPTPEELAAQQTQAEAADRAVRMEEATIAEKQASAAQKGAASAKAEAETRHAETKAALAGVQAQMAAVQAALAAMSAPGAAPVADGILGEAGFKTRSEKDRERRSAAINAAATEIDAMAEQEAAMAEEAAMADAAAATGAPQRPAPQP